MSYYQEKYIKYKLKYFYIKFNGGQPPKFTPIDKPPLIDKSTPKSPLLDKSTPKSPLIDKSTPMDYYFIPPSRRHSSIYNNKRNDYNDKLILDKISEITESENYKYEVTSSQMMFFDSLILYIPYFQNEDFKHYVTNPNSEYNNGGNYRNFNDITTYSIISVISGNIHKPFFVLHDDLNLITSLLSKPLDTKLYEKIPHYIETKKQRRIRSRQIVEGIIFYGDFNNQDSIKKKLKKGYMTDISDDKTIRDEVNNGVIIKYIKNFIITYLTKIIIININNLDYYKVYNISNRERKVFFDFLESFKIYIPYLQEVPDRQALNEQRSTSLEISEEDYVLVYSNLFSKKYYDNITYYIFEIHLEQILNILQLLIKPIIQTPTQPRIQPIIESSRVLPDHLNISEYNYLLPKINLYHNLYLNTNHNFKNNELIIDVIDTILNQVTDDKKFISDKIREVSKEQIEFFDDYIIYIPYYQNKNFVQSVTNPYSRYNIDGSKKNFYNKPIDSNAKIISGDITKQFFVCKKDLIIISNILNKQNSIDKLNKENELLTSNLRKSDIYDFKKNSKYIDDISSNTALIKLYTEELDKLQKRNIK